MTIQNIDAKLCDGCGICERSCPMDVIRMDEESGKAVIRYQSDCMACYNCELQCAAGAVSVSPERGLPDLLMWD